MRKIISTSIIIVVFTVLALIGQKLFNNILLNKFNNVAPKQYAIEKALTHKKVIELLGNDITVEEKLKENKKKGSFTFSLNSKGFKVKQNSVDLNIKLKGQKNSASLRVLAFKENSKWVYKKLYVIIPSLSKEIKLPKPEKL